MANEILFKKPVRNVRLIMLMIIFSIKINPNGNSYTWSKWRRKKLCIRHKSVSKNKSAKEILVLWKKLWRRTVCLDRQTLTAQLAIYVDVLTVIYSYIPDESPEKERAPHTSIYNGYPDNMAHYVYCPEIKWVAILSRNKCSCFIHKNSLISVHGCGNV